MLQAPGSDDRRQAWLLAEVRTAQRSLDEKIAEARDLPDTQPSKTLRIKRYNELQREVDTTVSTLTGQTKLWADQDIPSFYREGFTTAASDIGANFGFTLPHREAIEVLSYDAYDDVGTHLQQVSDNFAATIMQQEMYEGLDSRQLAVIRERSRSRVAQGLLTGEADQKKLARELAQDLWKENVQIVDSAGRNWRMESYTRMLIRTKSANAYSSGTLNKYTEEGVERVKVFDGTDDDTECAEANGQVWAISHAMQNVIQHPNCRRAFGAVQGGGEVDQGDPNLKSSFGRIDKTITAFAGIRAIRRFGETGDVDVSSTLAKLFFEVAEAAAGVPIILVDDFVVGAVSHRLPEVNSWIRQKITPAMVRLRLMRELQEPVPDVITQKSAQSVLAKVAKATTRSYETYPGASPEAAVLIRGAVKWATAVGDQTVPVQTAQKLWNLYNPTRLGAVVGEIIFTEARLTIESVTAIQDAITGLSRIHRDYSLVVVKRHDELLAIRDALRRELVLIDGTIERTINPAGLTFIEAQRRVVVEKLATTERLLEETTQAVLQPPQALYFPAGIDGYDAYNEMAWANNQLVDIEDTITDLIRNPSVSISSYDQSTVKLRIQSFIDDFLDQYDGSDVEGMLVKHGFTEDEARVLVDISINGEEIRDSFDLIENLNQTIIDESMDRFGGGAELLQDAIEELRYAENPFELLSVEEHDLLFDERVKTFLESINAPGPIVGDADAQLAGAPTLLALSKQMESDLHQLDKIAVVRYHTPETLGPWIMGVTGQVPQPLASGINGTAWLAETPSLRQFVIKNQSSDHSTAGGIHQAALSYALSTWLGKELGANVADSRIIPVRNDFGGRNYVSIIALAEGERYDDVGGFNKRANLFEILQQERDGHGGNYMTLSSGEIVSIDNEVSFFTEIDAYGGVPQHLPSTEPYEAYQNSLVETVRSYVAIGETVDDWHDVLPVDPSRLVAPYKLSKEEKRFVLSHRNDARSWGFASGSQVNSGLPIVRGPGYEAFKDSEPVWYPMTLLTRHKHTQHVVPVMHLTETDAEFLTELFKIDFTEPIEVIRQNPVYQRMHEAVAEAIHRLEPIDQTRFAEVTWNGSTGVATGVVPTAIEEFTVLQLERMSIRASELLDDGVLNGSGYATTVTVDDAVVEIGKSYAFRDHDGSLVEGLVVAINIDGAERWTVTVVKELGVGRTQTQLAKLVTSGEFETETYRAAQLTFESAFDINGNPVRLTRVEPDVLTRLEDFTPYRIEQAIGGGSGGTANRKTMLVVSDPDTGAIEHIVERDIGVEIGYNSVLVADDIDEAGKVQGTSMVGFSSPTDRADVNHLVNQMLSPLPPHLRPTYITLKPEVRNARGELVAGRTVFNSPGDVEQSVKVEISLPHLYGEKVYEMPDGAPVFASGPSLDKLERVLSHEVGHVADVRTRDQLYRDARQQVLDMAAAELGVDEVVAPDVLDRWAINYLDQYGITVPVPDTSLTQSYTPGEPIKLLTDHIARQVTEAYERRMEWLVEDFYVNKLGTGPRGSRMNTDAVPGWLRAAFETWDQGDKRVGTFETLAELYSHGYRNTGTVDPTINTIIDSVVDSIAPSTVEVPDRFRIIKSLDDIERQGPDATLRLVYHSSHELIEDNYVRATNSVELDGPGIGFWETDPDIPDNSFHQEVAQRADFVYGTSDPQDDYGNFIYEFIAPDDVGTFDDSYVDTGKAQIIRKFYLVPERTAYQSQIEQSVRSILVPSHPPIEDLTDLSPGGVARWLDGSYGDDLSDGQVRDDIVELLMADDHHIVSRERAEQIEAIIADTQAPMQSESYLRRTYTFDDPESGWSTEVERLSVGADHSEVSGYVYDENGANVGNFSRTITGVDGGGLEVYHNSWFITDSNAQASGFGRKFSDHMENHYRARGVESIKLSAAAVGRYYWPRRGFDWDYGGPDDMHIMSAVTKINEIAVDERWQYGKVDDVLMQRVWVDDLVHHLDDDIRGELAYVLDLLIENRLSPDQLERIDPLFKNHKRYRSFRTSFNPPEATNVALDWMDSVVIRHEAGNGDVVAETIRAAFVDGALDPTLYDLDPEVVEIMEWIVKASYRTVEAFPSENDRILQLLIKHEDKFRPVGDTDMHGQVQRMYNAMPALTRAIDAPTFDSPGTARSIGSYLHRDAFVFMGEVSDPEELKHLAYVTGEALEAVCNGVTGVERSIEILREADVAVKRIIKETKSDAVKDYLRNTIDREMSHLDEYFGGRVADTETGDDVIDLYFEFVESVVIESASDEVKFPALSTIAYELDNGTIKLRFDLSAQEMTTLGEDFAIPSIPIYNKPIDTWLGKAIFLTNSGRDYEKSLDDSYFPFEIDYEATISKTTKSVRKLMDEGTDSMGWDIQNGLLTFESVAVEGTMSGDDLDGVSALSKHAALDQFRGLLETPWDHNYARDSIIMDLNRANNQEGIPMTQRLVDFTEALDRVLATSETDLAADDIDVMLTRGEYLPFSFLSTHTRLPDVPSGQRVKMDAHTFVGTTEDSLEDFLTESIIIVPATLRDHIFWLANSRGNALGVLPRGIELEYIGDDVIRQAGSWGDFDEVAAGFWVVRAVPEELPPLPEVEILQWGDIALIPKYETTDQRLRIHTSHIGQNAAAFYGDVQAQFGRNTLFRLIDPETREVFIEGLAMDQSIIRSSGDIEITAVVGGGRAFHIPTQKWLATETYSDNAVVTIPVQAMEGLILQFATTQPRPLPRFVTRSGAFRSQVDKSDLVPLLEPRGDWYGNGDKTDLFNRWRTRLIQRTMPAGSDGRTFLEHIEELASVVPLFDDMWKEFTKLVEPTVLDEIARVARDANWRSATQRLNDMMTMVIGGRQPTRHVLDQTFHGGGRFMGMTDLNIVLRNRPNSMWPDMFNEITDKDISSVHQALSDTIREFNALPSTKELITRRPNATLDGEFYEFRMMWLGGLEYVSENWMRHMSSADADDWALSSELMNYMIHIMHDDHMANSYQRRGAAVLQSMLEDLPWAWRQLTLETGQLS